MKKLTFFVLILSAVLIGCGANKQPVLYPNSHFNAVGPSQAQKDIDACSSMAEQYVTKHQDEKVAEGAVKGAAIGAATGAAVGAVTGNFGRGLAAGAAGGAAGGATHGAFKAGEPSPVYKNFVNRGLKERGYDVIGWQ